MSKGEQGASQPPPRRRVVSSVMAALPFIITALVAVALSLLVQALLAREPSPATPPDPTPTTAPIAASPPRITPTTPPTPTATRTLAARATPTPTVSPTPVAIELLDDAALRQEVVRLRAEVNQLWSAYYLARAASQLADAEAALRVNNLNEVEQVLITVGVSLERAYERSPEQDKGPISEFRLQIARMLEELHVRPEGMDQDLRRLRQSMLSLVDEEE